MTQILDALVNLLTLERIEENLFRGASQDLGFPQLFGGQVLGQVISAASQTVTPERHVHSLPQENFWFVISASSMFVRP